MQANHSPIPNLSPAVMALLDGDGGTAWEHQVEAMLADGRLTHADALRIVAVVCGVDEWGMGIVEIVARHIEGAR